MGILFLPFFFSFCCAAFLVLCPASPVLLWPQQFLAGYIAYPSFWRVVSWSPHQWVTCTEVFLPPGFRSKLKPGSRPHHPLLSRRWRSRRRPPVRSTRFVGIPLGCGLWSWAWEPLHKTLTELPCLPAGCSFLWSRVSLQELQPILPCCPGARGWLQSGAARLPGSSEPAGGRVWARDCLWGGRSSRFVSPSKPFRIGIISLCKSLMSSCADSMLSWFAKLSVQWDFLHSPPANFN